MSDLPRRKPLRLPGYDYTRPGYYFVTVCTAVRGENILAEIHSDIPDAFIGGHTSRENILAKPYSDIPDPFIGGYASKESIPARIHSDILAVGAAALGGPSPDNIPVPRVHLTAAGEIVERLIENIGHVYRGQAGVDCHVVMPDHIHMVVWLRERESGPPENGRNPGDGSPEKEWNPGDGSPEKEWDPGDGPPRAAAPTVALPKIINTLKGLTSKKIGCSLWQRGYYEHIIRNDEDLQNTRQYIRDNPLKWLLNQCPDDPAP